MTGEHVFLYCERGTDPALLAEPINALSNLAFLFVALIGLQLVLWRPREQQSADHFLLVALVFFIGLGSLAFHMLATQQTALADVVPISVFMLVYLGFALNRFLAVPPAWTVLSVIGFAAIISLAGQVKCGNGLIGFFGPDAQTARQCLNGSVFYLPALAALIVVGFAARERGQRAAPYLLWAAAIFAVSVTLRSLDMAFCDQIQFDGRKVGTHFAWHLLNALTLFLLLRASLEGGAQAVAETPALIPPPGEDVPTPVEVVPADTEPAGNDAEEIASTEAEATPEEPAALEPEVTAEEPAEAESEEGPKKPGKSPKKKSFFPA